MKSFYKIILINVMLIMLLISSVLFINNISFGETIDESGRKTYSSPEKPGTVRLGDLFNLDYNDYVDSNTLFCVEHGEKLRPGWVGNYQVINKVTITGDTATGFKYDTVKEEPNNDANYRIKKYKSINEKSVSTPKGKNAQLAAAIDLPSRLEYSLYEKRRAIWYYMCDWVEDVAKDGKNFTNVKKSLVNPNHEGIDKNLEKEINNYVSKVKDEKVDAKADIKNTDIEAVTKKFDGIEYTRFGPFKIDFYPELAKMEIKGYKENDETAYRVSEFIIRQSNETIELKELKSNKNFYICIPSDQNIKQIAYMKVTTKKPEVSYKNIEATIAFLKITQRKNDALQNLILVESKSETVETEPKEVVKEWDRNGEPPPSGESGSQGIKIVKVDEDTKTPIAGAKFEVFQIKPYTTAITINSSMASDGRTQIITIRDERGNPVDGINDNTEIITDDGTKTLIKEIRDPEIPWEITIECLADSSGKLLNISDDPSKKTITSYKNYLQKYGDRAVYKKDEEYINYVNNIEINTEKEGAEIKDESIKKNFEIITGDRNYSTIVTTNEKGEAFYNTNKYAKFLIREIEVPHGYGDLELQKSLNNANIKIVQKLKDAPHVIYVYCENRAFGELELNKFIDYANGKTEIFPGVNFRFYFIDNDGNKQYLVDEFSEPRKHNPEIEIESSNAVKNRNEEEYECRENPEDEGHQTKTYTYGIQESAITFYEFLRITEEQANDRITAMDNFTTNVGKAKIFTTDENGKINIKYLPAGRIYHAEEVGFEDKENEELFEFEEDDILFDLTHPESSKEATYKVSRDVNNKIKYINLSGYVWKDVPDAGKRTVRNSLYKDSTDDDNDELISGVIVRLCQEDNEGDSIVIQETETDENGKYVFNKVDIAELEKYYIEFTYNGLAYTNVKPYNELAVGIDKDNTSKAKENDSERDSFNEQFFKIEKDVAKDEEDNETYQLSYSKIEKSEEDIEFKRKQKVVLDGLYNIKEFPIVANTNETGYSIKNKYDQLAEKAEIVKEISNINLGLYEREQPDLSLQKSLEEVELSMNNYNHIYKYEGRLEKEHEFEETKLVYDETIEDWVESTLKEFQVGVKFGEGDGAYSLPVYEADYTYENESDRNSELQAWITYKIEILNQSTTLDAKVNSIIDFFDERYDENEIEIRTDSGEIIPLNVSDKETISGFKKIKIDTTSLDQINAKKSSIIYVKFKLSREQIAQILDGKGEGEKADEKDLLDNVVEINSYSIFRNDKIYAGIDKNSNPGNADIDNVEEWENDTSNAASLRLEVATKRTMSGKVFLDETTGELMTGQERQGDGRYTEGEKGISGVTVELLKKNIESEEFNVIANTTTNVQGDYIFDEYKDENDKKHYLETGEYKVAFKWGGQNIDDKKITVQDYKGTIYDLERSQTNDPEGYNSSEVAKAWAQGKEIEKNNVETRYSDAIDDYNTRIEIDKEITYVDQLSKTNDKTINEMTSETYPMSVPIEFGDIMSGNATDYTTSYDELLEKLRTTELGERLPYDMKNIDFGIVERPRQHLEVTKRVSEFKINLANASTLIDATIDESGNKSGEQKNLTMSQGVFVKGEMDNELMQNATLQVEYTINVKNMSELDYATQEYYKYGTKKENIITITPSGIIDYLDNEWGFNKNEEGNSDWNQVKLLDIQSYTERRDILLDTNVKNKDYKTVITENGLNKEVTNDIANRKILYTDSLTNVALEPAREKMRWETPWTPRPIITNSESCIKTLKLKVSKTLSSGEDIALTNEVETTRVINGPKDLEKDFVKAINNLDSTIYVHTGREIDTTPGNYVPGTLEHESDSYTAEEVLVTPNTGENRNYIVPVSISLVALITLGAGAILVKKKVLNN